MNGRYKKLIVIPIVIIVISLYLIGVNIINRVDRIDDLKEAVPAADYVESVGKSEEEEDAQLEAITDKININTATKSELMLLDGVGELIAERIVKRREKIGNFTSIDQLLEIDGLGEKKYNAIKDYIEIGE